MRPALPAFAVLALLIATPGAPAAVRVAPVGVRPHGTLIVHVTGRLPQTLSIDGRRIATARHASTHVSLRSRIAEGRHRLRACRGRSCATSAPFVVTSGPIVGGCPVLPPDSPWNTDVSSAPLAADSAALVGAQATGHAVHLDFGDTQSEYGIPYALVGPNQRRVPIAFGTDGADYGDESDHGPFPIPPTAPIEGAPAGQPDPQEGDRHVIVIQRERCVDYELYNAVRRDGGASWQVSSSARWDLTRNGRRPAGWTSADAAGLPIFPGLLRYDEAASGTIRHALRFTLPRARRLAGAGDPLRHRDRPLHPALRLALAAEGLLRRDAVQRPRAGHRARAQALRADLRRPGLVDVHHRHDRPALDADDRGHQPAPPDPR